MLTIKRWVRERLKTAGYVVFNTGTKGLYARDGLFTFNSSRFVDDPSFKAAYQRGIRASRGVDPGIEWRLHVALWAAKCALSVEGDFVECGVNAGFVSSAIMHSLEWQHIQKAFILVDTFNGPVLSQYSEDEVKRGRRRAAEEAITRGAYITDLERVIANFAEWPNAKIVQGAVPDILAQLNLDRVAFLHLDMNCAYPERCALLHFWEKLSPGGVVLLDDYAAYGYYASAIAVDNAAKSLGVEVLSLPTGQGIMWKRMGS